MLSWVVQVRCAHNGPRASLSNTATVSKVWVGFWLQVIDPKCGANIDNFFVARCSKKAAVTVFDGKNSNEISVIGFSKDVSV